MSGLRVTVAVLALALAGACTVIYLDQGAAPALQHLGGGNPSCLIACDTANSATAVSGGASSVQGSTINQTTTRPGAKPASSP